MIQYFIIIWRTAYVETNIAYTFHEVICLAVFLEYTNADGIHIAWHDERIEHTAAVKTLLNEAALIYENALKNTDAGKDEKENVCDISEKKSCGH